jgi:hypothetical protein
MKSAIACGTTNCCSRSCTCRASRIMLSCGASFDSASSTVTLFTSVGTSLASVIALIRYCAQWKSICGSLMLKGCET